jgi:hypothetical protein
MLAHMRPTTGGNNSANYTPNAQRTNKIIGKTLLATEKAWQLAGCGKRTLVLCYNKLIASQMSGQFTPAILSGWPGLTYSLTW